MRKNLSEELKINDDVVLNDGSEAKEEEDKKAKEVEKEVQKELDSKNKINKELANAKTPDAKANNGLGKSTKIKQFVEKLVLEEPSDTLNEDFSDDEMMEAYFDALHEVYKVFSDYAFILQSKFHLDKSAIESELYAISEEAIIRFLDGDFEQG